MGSPNAPLNLTLSDLERLNSQNSQNNRVRPNVTINHQYETIYGESNGTVTFDLE